jgi:hypothetical protein
VLMYRTKRKTERSEVEVECRSIVIYHDSVLKMDDNNTVQLLIIWSATIGTRARSKSGYKVLYEVTSIRFFSRLPVIIPK